MDPSNNNSFGSPQVPGAIVSDGNTSVDNTAMNNTSGGFTSTNFPAGGITVGESSGKGPRKGLIIGVIVAFVLLLGGGLVALAAMNGVFGGGNEQSSIQENDADVLRKTFNGYVNYIASGNVSEGDINADILADLAYPYFEDLSVSDMKEYVKNANEKFELFAKNYEASDGVVEIIDMKTYYQDYAAESPLEYQYIETFYNQNGFDATEKMINEYFEQIDGGEIFESYVMEAKNVALLQLRFIDDAKNNNCYENGVLISGCYNYSEQEEKTLIESLNNMVLYRDNMFRNAVDAIEAVYMEVYGTENE